MVSVRPPNSASLVFSGFSSTTGCVLSSGRQTSISLSNSNSHWTSIWYPALVICSSLHRLFVSRPVFLRTFVLTSRNGKHVWPCHEQPRNSYIVWVFIRPHLGVDVRAVGFLALFYRAFGIRLSVPFIPTTSAPFYYNLRYRNSHPCEWDLWYQASETVFAVPCCNPTRSW